MTTTVTLFTQPGCGPCIVTKRHLERLRVEHAVVNIRNDEAAAALILARGFTGTPVVIASTPHGERSWQGYKTDQIEALPHFLKENS